MATTHYKTKVVLYKGIPFGIDYNHTLEPTLLDAKLDCLNANYTHDTYTDLQTIHMNSATDAGSMRLVVKAEDAYDYNYAYIEDPQHGLKFCAFITGCRYINDANTSPSASSSVYKCVFEFGFEKDLLMTYMYASYLHEAPILRHTATNAFNNGYHAETVDLQTVDYLMYNTNIQLGYLYPSSNTYTVLWCNFNWDKASDPTLVPDSTLNGILNCVLGLVYKSTSDVKTDLRKLAAEQGFQLLGVTTMPNFMYDWDAAPGLSTISGKPLVDAYVTDKLNYTISSKHTFKNEVENQAVYHAKNKKCFYYPYCKFTLESNSGSVIELAPEYLNRSAGINSDIKLNVTCAVGRPCSYTVTPDEYGAVNNIKSPNLKCTTGTFPEGCATLDSYSMYLAERYKTPDNFLGMALQHMVEGVPGIMGSAANLGIVSGGVQSGSEVEIDTPVGKTGTGMYDYSGNKSVAASGIGGIVSSAGQALLTADAMKRKSDPIFGAVSSPDTDYIRNNVNVMVRFSAIHPKELIGLDEYFERYGYSQGGEIHVPDLSGRSRYVYCQTGGNCFSSPSCNSVENAKINKLLMNGVTFWKTSAIRPYASTLSYGDNGDDTIDDAM